MAKLRECAEHFGASEPTTKALLERAAIPFRDISIDEVRLRTFRYLREKVAGRQADEGLDLATERAKTERVARELKELQVAEKRNSLINISQLEPDLQQAFSSFRAELLARDDKLVEALQLKYKIKVDAEILNEHTYRALEQLYRYDPSSTRFDSEDGAESEASREDNDD